MSDTQSSVRPKDVASEEASKDATAPAICECEDKVACTCAKCSCDRCSSVEGRDCPCCKHECACCGHDEFIEKCDCAETAGDEISEHGEALMEACVACGPDGCVCGHGPCACGCVGEPARGCRCACHGDICTCGAVDRILLEEIAEDIEDVEDDCACGRHGHGYHHGTMAHRHFAIIDNPKLMLAAGAAQATDLVLRVIAIRRAIKKGQKGWILPLAVVNSMGILPTLYLATKGRGK